MRLTLTGDASHTVEIDQDGVHVDGEQRQLTRRLRRFEAGVRANETGSDAGGH